MLSRLFGLLSSSLLLSVQGFGRCALRTSLCISCRTREPSCRNRQPSQNFEPNPLFSPRGYPVLIPLTIVDYDLKVPEFEKKVPEFETAPESDIKYLKKARGHISRNVVQITMKMRTIVRIIQIILIIKPHPKNSEK